MLEGYRLELVAIELALSGPILIICFEAVDAPKTYEACEQGHLAYCETAPPSFDAKKDSSSRFDADEQSTRAEYRNEKDLRAQEQMALWAAWTLFTTVIGLALLFLTWFETTRVTRETRRVGEKQAQAYLTASEGALWLGEVGGMLALSASMLVKNKGQSPASDITVSYRGYLSTLIDGPLVNSWRSYENFEENESFCRNIAPDDQDEALMQFRPFANGSPAELTFRSNQSSITIEGTIHWTNEFGNSQRQTFIMCCRPFIESNFDAPEGRRKKRIELVAGARRRPEDATRAREKYYGAE